MIKTCKKCLIPKEATTEFFYSHHGTKDKLENVCKACKLTIAKVAHDTNEYREKHRVYWKEWRKKNHKKRLKQEQDRDRERLYGVTPLRFQELAKNQNNSCAICLEPFEKSPHVDHNHITKKARGLLCHFCNTLLGYAKEDTNILARAVSYLEKHKED